MNDTMLGRMLTLAGGEEFNGFELWRALHVEFRGGSVEMTCNERGFFLDFPTCDKIEDLQNHIVQWKKLQVEHGVGLPDEHLRHMFRKIIPEHVVEELKKLHVSGQMATWNLEYDYVYKEISRLNDSRMSKFNLQRLNEAIKPRSAQKISHVGSEQWQPTEAMAPRFQTCQLCKRTSSAWWPPPLTRPIAGGRMTVLPRLDRGAVPQIPGIPPRRNTGHSPTQNSRVVGAAARRATPEPNARNFSESEPQMEERSRGTMKVLMRNI